MNAVLRTAMCIAALNSCGLRQETSLVKITNGKIVAEADFPAVVNLFRRIVDKQGKFLGGATCTATWIDDVTLITAAHCLGDEDSDSVGMMKDPQLIVFEIVDATTDPKLTKGITQASEAYRNKAWETNKGFNKYDLAILRMPPAQIGERPRQSISINHHLVTVGTSVQIIGYGFNNMSLFGKGGDDLKRIGNNRIDSAKNGFLNIVGKVKDSQGGPTGEKASAGNGDSGGPMLEDGRLIGVASGGGAEGVFARGESSYVDLNSPESKEFLARFGF